MSYIISGYSGYSGLSGNAADVAKELGKGLEGNGKKDDPFGGAGGAWGDSSNGKLAEKALSKLTRKGVVFADPPGGKVEKFQDGVFFASGEKYVYVKSVKGKQFYKFRVQGSSVGHDTSDAQAQAWFNRIVAAAKATMAPKPGPIEEPLLDTGGDGSEAGDVSEAGAGGGTTMLIVGVAVAVSAIILLKGRKGAGA